MFWTVLGVEPLCCTCLATLWLALVPCCGSVLLGWPGEFFARARGDFLVYAGEGVPRIDGCMGQMRQQIEKSVVNRHTPRSAPKFVSGSPPR